MPRVCGRRRSIARASDGPQLPFGRTMRSMRITLIVLGLLLVGSGVVWMAQGLNLPFAPRSFMTADRSWVLIGAVAVVAGVVVLGWGRRRGVS